MSGFTAPSVLGISATAVGARATEGAPEAVLAATGVAFGAYLALALALLVLGAVLRFAAARDVAE